MYESYPNLLDERWH